MSSHLVVCQLSSICQCAKKKLKLDSVSTLEALVRFWSGKFGLDKGRKKCFLWIGFTSRLVANDIPGEKKKRQGQRRNWKNLVFKCFSNDSVVLFVCFKIKNHLKQLRNLYLLVFSKDDEMPRHCPLKLILKHLHKYYFNWKWKIDGSSLWSLLKKQEKLSDSITHSSSIVATLIKMYLKNFI